MPVATRRNGWVYVNWSLYVDRTTVEPLTNDHSHQRPSLSYAHLSCDGQCFLFVYTNPSRATIPLIRPHQCDSEGGRIRGVPLYWQKFGVGPSHQRISQKKYASGSFTSMQPHPELPSLPILWEISRFLIK